MYFLWISILYLSSCKAIIVYNATGKDPFSGSNLPPYGYGNFQVKTLFYETCEDTEADSRFETNLKLETDSLNQQVLKGYSVIRKDVQIQKLNILVGTFKNGKPLTFLNNTGITRCDHVAMIPIKMMFDIDKNCVILKGNHTLKYSKPDDMYHKAIGSKSMFGRISCKIEYFSEDKLVICVNLIQDLLPLPKKKKKN